MPPKQMLSPSFLFLFLLFTSSMANEAAGVPMESNMAPENGAIRNYIPDSDNTFVSRPPPLPKHVIVTLTYGQKSPPPPSLVPVQELDTPAKPPPPTCFPLC